MSRKGLNKGTHFTTHMDRCRTHVVSCMFDWLMGEYESENANKQKCGITLTHSSAQPFFPESLQGSPHK